MNEREATPKSKVLPPPVLHLPVVERGQIHPYAAQQYFEFVAQVFEEVPSVDLLNDEDLRLFLSTTEYTRLKICRDEIKAWLEKCRGMGEAMLVPFDIPFNSRWDLKKLLKETAERKMGQARQEAEKKMRLAALKAMAVPLEDAEKYLTPEEYEIFPEGVRGAVEAYLNTGKEGFARNWRVDYRAALYLELLARIEKRKEEDAHRQQARAILIASQTITQAAIQKWKQDLSGVGEPAFGYPLALAKYNSHKWCQLEVPQGVEEWAAPRILEKVPQGLRNMIAWDLTYRWMALPHCLYTVIRVPCLEWNFKMHVLVKVVLKTKKDDELIGYLFFGPVFWQDGEGFTTPLVLLPKLAREDPEGNGISVVHRSAPWTTFTVEGFPEEVVIHDDFVRFIRDISKRGALLSTLLRLGVIDTETSRLIKRKLHNSLKQADKMTAAATPDLAGQVVEKLVSLGWTQNSAAEKVKNTAFPPGASVDVLVKSILATTPNAD